MKQQYIVFAYVVLLMFFFSLLPQESLVGMERIAATYFLSLLIIYGITLNWKVSFIFALLAILIVGFIDQKGFFYDWRNIQPKQYEFFDELKPAGEGTGPDDIKEGDTIEVDNTKINEDDLDSILKEDEQDDKKQNEKQEEFLSKTDGGLGNLDQLLQMAAKESPYADKNDVKEYTPAQAQRETYRMIDTVKQLKETMSEMMPLMKAGNNLMSLYNKMGGKELLKNFN
jgi:hypothetical protein